MLKIVFKINLHSEHIFCILKKQFEVTNEICVYQFETGQWPYTYFIASTFSTFDFCNSSSFCQFINLFQLQKL